MTLVVEFPLAWAGWALLLIAVMGFSFGLFSAAWPKASIALYTGMLAKFNWRVSPIDEPRELKTTRRFGILLVLLGLATFGFIAFTLALVGRP